MTWKDHLQSLESSHQWDKAISFMQGILQSDPDNKDAYIFMNYLLMNLLIEEDYDKQKEKQYITLLKWYFDESYAKFSNDAEYLYFTAITAVMGEWFFNIDVKDYEEMFKRAQEIEPENLLYKESYYLAMTSNDPYSPQLKSFAIIALSEDSPMRQQLKDKGAVGEYALEMQQSWTRNALDFMNNDKP